MQILYAFGALLLSYLIGSIPIGWIIVKISTGRDIRWIESGRTGGTNVMRAAGFLAGLLTGIGDIAKGILAVSVSRWLTPDGTLLRQVIEIAGPLLAIVGHNYSIYLLERLESGKLVLRGGAGGATCFGGAVGLWAPVALYVFPLAAIIYIVVGYASITTMSIALIATLVFALRAVLELGPWHYVLYGLISQVLLVWALRPNLQRLREGTERLHGLRVWLKKAR
jgi:glycerol-3-phosphate acyltransferase PlsY